MTQSSSARQATITAYCLKGRTTSGPRTAEIQEQHGRPPIALSRKLAKDLGLYRGPGQYDYRFGCTIEVTGVGRFVFADLMPTQWRGYRVDIWIPSHGKALAFGIRKAMVRVVREGEQ